ncbi:MULTISPECIES: hypothetical protein [Mycobacterium]|uniref:PD-(D/E)XK nuclease superfamily protein n=1 Tax=Mycobacterium paraffinicum TaxID=53378 RepID=A0A1Q4HPK2_9MYCO|nr:MULTISPECIES: hypothetical protein [Mycobacterium]OCB20048.1 hypothetical protein A5689_21285 [Mycobacterium intracellulare subsp. yongonense]OJZ69473.1 hypothetical protein BRW65_23000 [Mycobacterium paraffinicum]
MASLTRYGAEVESAFSLLGQNENDLTAALGFTMARCTALSDAILRRVWPALGEVEDVSFALEVRAEIGRTDLEVRLPASSALVIFEAKRDWLLPTTTQLAQYVSRIHRSGSGAMVSLSQASTALAETQLPREIQGVPVVHLPWLDVLADITAARTVCRGRERIWLEELHIYLMEVIRMRTVADSMVYSVVLNEDRPGGEGTPTFREFVTDQLCYFHPYGAGGWPTDPPNFMAFRWGGAVQRIHRIMRADVVPTIRERFPYLPENDASDRPHAVYDLGPRIPPLEPIPNGAGIYPSSRLWVLLDQLQTAPTLKDALAGTRAIQDRWAKG